ncbi:MAG TPA: MmcQ/YjbR family DNA-binding protein [Vicinamibacterales bacterium]|jgi:hypothetical protein|nr:MmcQ/YjbR family DNA-binding protein [Vicinamibacterales bacterium]
MAKGRVTLAVVRRMALALPDVEEGTIYGAPAFRVRGQMFACQPSHRSAEPGSLVVRVSFETRDELLAADPATYYITEHYVGYTSVLVRLSRIQPDAMRDLLHMAYSLMSTKATRRPAVRARRRIGPGRRADR